MCSWSCSSSTSPTGAPPVWGWGAPSSETSLGASSREWAGAPGGGHLQRIPGRAWRPHMNAASGRAFPAPVAAVTSQETHHEPLCQLPPSPPPHTSWLPRSRTFDSGPHITAPAASVPPPPGPLLCRPHTCPRAVRAGGGGRLLAPILWFPRAPPTPRVLCMSTLPGLGHAPLPPLEHSSLVPGGGREGPGRPVPTGTSWRRMEPRGPVTSTR